ncbi:MAG: NUDIX hydrolase [Paludibacteraceae bacterium]|nr:NUDIX hydrolase [Paludibacteraceae bacterium]
METPETEPMKKHIALDIVTNYKGEILIIKRKKKEEGTNDVTLSWAFPGGKVEKDEDVKDAAAREVLEETCYNVGIKDEISCREHPQFPVYVHYIVCEISDM